VSNRLPPRWLLELDIWSGGLFLLGGCAFLAIGLLSFLFLT
jgi:hypothetical protein